MLVDVGNGFPEVLEMMECGYFRLFELVVWLFIVVFSVIFGYFGSSFGHFWLYYQFPINIPPLI